MTTGIAILGVLWLGLIVCLLFFFKGSQQGDENDHNI